MLTRNKLIDLIECFTKKNGVMPQKVCGPFALMDHVQCFYGVELVGEEYVLRTVVGDLRFELDHMSSDIYLK